MAKRGRLQQDKIIDGGAAGAITPFAARILGPRFGAAGAMIGVGMYRNNETLQTMGGYAVGQQLVQSAPGTSQPAGGFI